MHWIDDDVPANQLLGAARAEVERRCIWPLFDASRDRDGLQMERAIRRLGQRSGSIILTPMIPSAKQHQRNGLKTVGKKDNEGKNEEAKPRNAR